MATAAARRYAKAVFELAQQDGDVELWARRLARIRELFADRDVAAVLSNPTIATERREQLIAETQVLDKEGTNLARLLVESGRVKEAPAIEEEFQRLDDEASGRVRATATTAVEITAEDREQIRRELSQRLNKDVRLSVVVDPRILGGLRLQFGDHLIDASIASRLAQLRQRLVTS
ncbi:MAG TPA: F0F1 ATP synthase subunit delta [Candidatus Dormibacteraeota bacterium]|nr:F0F1 ATP synthase subunit delta [Candidatus Dormibacteraeota bacterium]